jgi:CubicO group peptidase (beta-lactamase class C family)
MNIRLSKKFKGVVSISIDNHVVYSKATGCQDFGNQVSNQLNTRFATASAGKIFIAVAILQLIEQGLISFEHEIGEIIPIDWKAIDPTITVFELLVHTSGIPDYFDESIMSEYSELWHDIPNYRIRKSLDLFPLFIDKPMMYPKGTRFQYNNTGFVVLGHIIEVITKHSFDEYLKEHVFKPATMNDTGYFELDRLPKRCANHYIWDETKQQYYTNIYSVDAKGSGAGGAYTTANDIKNFWQALLSYKLLSSAMTEKMLSVHVHNETGNHYGLGVWFNHESKDSQKPFFTGFDPGVSFVSEFNRESNQLITIFSNYGDNVWSELSSIKKQLHDEKC